MHGLTTHRLERSLLCKQLLPLLEDLVRLDIHLLKVCGDGLEFLAFARVSLSVFDDERLDHLRGGELLPDDRQQKLRVVDLLDALRLLALLLVWRLILAHFELVAGVQI